MKSNKTVVLITLPTANDDSFFFTHSTSNSIGFRFSLLGYFLFVCFFHCLVPSMQWLIRIKELLFERYHPHLSNHKSKKIKKEK